MQAILDGVVIAESDETVVVEGNHYFPVSSVRQEVLGESDLETGCPWKGTASYYNLNASGNDHANAAWYYATPKDAAAEIKDRVAFGSPVVVQK